MFFMPWARGMGLGNAHGTESVSWPPATAEAIKAVGRATFENNEPAIRKYDRKERDMTIKSEAIAKVYVIENEVVR